MKVDVIGSNSLLFANLPPASQVPGRTYRVSNVGPAPGILLTSNGTRWRPSGGRQVLAMRSDNPVTVQNTSDPQYAETVGPFPGGLVRAGMLLHGQYQYDHSGIGTGSRAFRAHIVNTPNSGISGNAIVSHAMTTSGSALVGANEGVLLIRSDNGSVPGISGVATANSYSPGGISISSGVNFSLPWYMQITMRSSNETATNITSVSWAGGIATFNNTAHTLAAGDKTTVAGVSVGGYNGVWIVNSVINGSTWTAIMADPGAAGTGGTSSRISNMISQSYVLELVG